METEHKNVVLENGKSIFLLFPCRLDVLSSVWLLDQKEDKLFCPHYLISLTSGVDCGWTLDCCYTCVCVWTLHDLVRLSAVGVNLAKEAQCVSLTK